jgi:hypothetical protein
MSESSETACTPLHNYSRKICRRHASSGNKAIDVVQLLCHRQCVQMENCWLVHLLLCCCAASIDIIAR